MLVQSAQHMSAKTNNVFTDIPRFVGTTISVKDYKHDTTHLNTKYLNSDYQKVQDQNETLKSEIKALKASIKSSENKLANIEKEIIVAKKETENEKN